MEGLGHLSKKNKYFQHLLIKIKAVVDSNLIQQQATRNVDIILVIAYNKNSRS